MAKLKNVEAQIWRVEGFEVRIRYAGPGPVKGRDVRGDREHVPGYPFRRRRADEDLVADWVEGRFRPNYVGFEVDVLDGAGRAVHGRTKLRNLRDTYFE